MDLDPRPIGTYSGGFSVRGTTNRFYRAAEATNIGEADQRQLVLRFLCSQGRSAPTVERWGAVQALHSPDLHHPGNLRQNDAVRGSGPDRRYESRMGERFRGFCQTTRQSASAVYSSELHQLTGTSRAWLGAALRSLPVRGILGANPPRRGQEFRDIQRNREIAPAAGHALFGSVRSFGDRQHLGTRKSGLAGQRLPSGGDANLRRRGH